MDANDHPAALGRDRLLADCEVRRTRRSGPGGQNRNKVETAIVLRHRPTGLSAEANERRSQAENHEVAVFRLRVHLAVAVRRPVDPAAEPSATWRSRCRGGRIAVNPAHDDFPTLLAEALDAAFAREGDVRATAEALDCTGTQFTRFLKLEPRALAVLNGERIRRGFHPLH